MRFWPVISILWLFLLPGVAAAEQPWPALVKVGLAGTWGHACNAPPSPSNWLITFSATANGGAQSRSNRGEDTRLTIVDGAQVVTPTTIRLQLRYADPIWGEANGSTFDVINEIVARRSRTLQSTRGDGTVLIKDGAFVANGQPSPTLEKCSN